MRLVSVEMLRPEMKIARPVYQQEALILPAGRNNVNRFIPNLKNMGIEYVYVEDDKSEGIEIPDAIAEKTRTNCKQVLQKTMVQFASTDRMEIEGLQQCVGDVISDIALYFPFLFLPESNALLVILMLFCTILTEFCGLLAQTINGIRSFAGPFGKSDRALIFGLWGLAVAIYPQWMQWNNLLWSIASILLLWTAINRCRSVLLMSAER